MSEPARQSNPYASYTADSQETANSTGIFVPLTTHEKIFQGIIILFIVFLFVVFFSAIFMIALPIEEPDSIAVLVGCAYFLILALGLCLTAATILRNRSQLTTPTIIQCGILVISCYGLPLAIWGGLLLRDRIRRERRKK